MNLREENNDKSEGNETKALVVLRRDFHRYAESNWREFRTASKVAEYLINHGMEVLLGEEIMVLGMGFGMPGPEAVNEDVKRAIAQGADGKQR